MKCTSILTQLLLMFVMIIEEWFCRNNGAFDFLTNFFHAICIKYLHIPISTVIDIFLHNIKNNSNEVWVLLTLLSLFFHILCMTCDFLWTKNYLYLVLFFYIDIIGEFWREGDGRNFRSIPNASCSESLLNLAWPSGWFKPRASRN